MNKKTKITLSIFITALSIFIIHIINQTLFFLSTIKEVLYSDNSNYYNWRFGKIHYTKKGTGTPLLLIHDLDYSSSDFEWTEIINELSETHTVYTLDLLGCGRSDKPKMTYTNFLYVQLINDFIKNVIKQKTDIAITGHACSAVITGCYTDSNLYRNIILINPDNLNKVNKVPKYKHTLLKYIIDFPILGTFIYNIAVSKLMTKDLFETKYFYNTDAIPERYINAYNEAAHTSGSASKYFYSSVKCHYTTTNFVHALKEINNSIYIIFGSNEDNMEDTKKQYLECNPSIETICIKNTKHLPQLENPEEFIETIDIFLVENIAY